MEHALGGPETPVAYKDLTREEIKKELSKYFGHCFGDAQRIDYGSGHELNFVMFLFCLDKLGKFTPEDDKALVLRVFHNYLELMRHIQKQYWLEPAGSHGVWGLDDYQFLPFLWGSAQLLSNTSDNATCLFPLQITSIFVLNRLRLLK